MLSKILRYLFILQKTGIMCDADGKPSNTSSKEIESINLLLNKPEAHALKSGHCMKEDCNVCRTLINVGESQSSVILPVSPKDCCELNKDSNISLGICRICHCNPETFPELGPLQSVCNCRGTVALVHMSCLERWLAESDSSTCELCRYEFNVERIPKHGALESMLVWINDVADFNQLLVDTIWFWLMTPLAAMAGYIFVKATSELIDDSFPTDAPWLMAALMINSCLTLVAYYGWVMNSVKKHMYSWYKWWRTMDCIIKIHIPERQNSATGGEIPPTVEETEGETSAEESTSADEGKKFPESTVLHHVNVKQKILSSKQNPTSSKAFRKGKKKREKTNGKIPKLINNKKNVKTYS